MRDIVVTLPDLHSGQAAAYLKPGRFKAIRAGRRWGKTLLGTTILANGAANGQTVGYFAPAYKYISETFQEILEVLEPVKRSSSETKGIIRTRSKGRVDFWTLEDDRAGRSRKYHTVVIDEAAFTKPNMLAIWERNIRPTLLDYGGNAYVLSNTNGMDPENFFWQICNEPRFGFTEFHAPTHTNPHLPPEELAKLEAENHPLVFRQEYLAEFVDWAGTAFFAEDSFLFNSQPVPPPAWCDSVFAVIDTATKTGKQHDGTAVTFYAYASQPQRCLYVVDWEAIQIEGALLETWLPTVFARLEELAKTLRARRGSLGAWVEDRSTGQVLLQHAARRGWPAQAIDTKLTAIGKDERAVLVSGYVHQRLVQITVEAYRKTTTYKGTTRNHWLSQVLGFRIGQKDTGREDDLFDTFTYGTALTFGNNQGL